MIALAAWRVLLSSVIVVGALMLVVWLVWSEYRKWRG